MSYKHGVYGVAAVTNSATDVSQGTIPAYIGSAPVHRINANGDPNFDYYGFVNTPILVSSLREAKELGLYSDDWKTYTLSEAISAHFMNGAQSVAPIVLLNILRPYSDVDKTSGSATVTMKRTGTGFVGYIEDALCVLDDIAIVVKDGDGVTIDSTACRYEGDSVVIEAKVTLSEGKENIASFTATATYKKIAFSADGVLAQDFDEALSTLDYCEQIVGVIPNIIAAPGFSEKPEFHAVMIQKAMDKIANKWNCVCVSDIPATQETYEEAIAWKNTNAYDSKYDKVCWPAVAHGDKVYHLSTVCAYMMQNIDAQNSDIPYASTSNKVLFCDRAVFHDSADWATLLISEAKANDANQAGITTVNSIKRSLRLWGAHMSNYNHAKVGSIAVEDRFDSSIRMMMYMLNHLQYQYINEIDQAFSRKDIDSIVNGVQTWLDSLVNDGMLLSASISFNNESASDAEIANGDFVFDLEVTYSVIVKSITFKLQYTSAGLVTLTTSGGEE